MLAADTPNLLIAVVLLVLALAGTGVFLARRKSPTPPVIPDEPGPAASVEPAPSVSGTIPPVTPSVTETPAPEAVDHAEEPAPWTGPSDERTTAGSVSSDGSGPAGSGPDAGSLGATGTSETELLAPSLREKSGRTRSLFGDAFRRVRGRAGVSQESWDDLEETLLLADLGVKLVDGLLAPLKARTKSGELTNPDQVIAELRSAMTAALSGSDRSLRLDAETRPNVWLFVGVNGVGKTTSIGKVGTAQTALGRSVLMAAGDTFRAAAAEQLQTWAERCGADFVRGSEGGDPASVIFDGIQAAHARGVDLVLADTAGRLQNKSNLMEELRKVRRVAEKAEGTVNEVLLVIDATTGQNGLSQAREFAAATDVTGVVLTKLDGSAKGGIVFAIETELGIPVKLVGLGETAADLVPFDPAEYVSALFE